MIPDKDTLQGTHISGAPLNERHDRQNEVQSLEEQQRVRCPDDNVNVEDNLSTHSPEEQQQIPGCPETRVLSTHSPVISDRFDELPLSSPSSSSSEGEDVAADDGDSESSSDSKESTTSSVSLKSDESKGKLINFNAQLSPRVSGKRRTSTGSRCSSIKSEGSPGHIKAKKRRSGSDFTSSSSTSSSSSSEEDVAADDGVNDTKNDKMSLPADE